MRGESRSSLTAHPLKPGIAPVRGATLVVGIDALTLALLIAGVAGYAHALNIGLFLCWLWFVGCLVSLVGDAPVYERGRRWVSYSRGAFSVGSCLVLAGDGRFVTAVVMVFVALFLSTFPYAVRQAHAELLAEEQAP